MSVVMAPVGTTASVLEARLRGDEIEAEGCLSAIIDVVEVNRRLGRNEAADGVLKWAEGLPSLRTLLDRVGPEVQEQLGRWSAALDVSVHPPSPPPPLGGARRRHLTPHHPAGIARRGQSSPLAMSSSASSAA